MFGSSRAASGEPKEAELAGSSPALPSGWRAAWPAAALARRRRVALRCGLLAALVLVYWGSLSTLHALVGNPAFLFGLALCLAAAVLLGVRGALAVIVGVALIDRSLALRLPVSIETGPVAGLIA